MLINSLELKLPSWVTEFLKGRSLVCSTYEERMQLVIELSRLNIQYKTGGPFAAAVFEMHYGRLISVGVNQVVSQNCSLAHAEAMALILAQRGNKTFDLGASSGYSYSLVSSSQPCVMCFGAIIWSGIKKLEFGASRDDVEEITGFDEGPLPLNWSEELTSRGIEVVSGVLQQKAVEILKIYKEEEGIIYNSQRGRRS